MPCVKFTASTEAIGLTSHSRELRRPLVDSAAPPSVRTQGKTQEALSQRPTAARAERCNELRLPGLHSRSDSERISGLMNSVQTRSIALQKLVRVAHELPPPQAPTRIAMSSASSSSRWLGIESGSSPGEGPLLPPQPRTAKTANRTAVIEALGTISTRR